MDLTVCIRAEEENAQKYLKQLEALKRVMDCEFIIINNCMSSTKEYEACFYSGPCNRLNTFRMTLSMANGMLLVEDGGLKETLAA